jgi:hypothetical protein
MTDQPFSFPEVPLETMNESRTLSILTADAVFLAKAPG